MSDVIKNEHDIFALDKEHKNTMLQDCVDVAGFLRTLMDAVPTLINGAPAFAYKWELPNSDWYFTLLDDMSGWNIHILYVGNSKCQGEHQHISWHPLSPTAVQITGSSKSIDWFEDAINTFNKVKHLRVLQLEGFEI